MKDKLVKIFTNRWVLAALGLILVSLLIWFVGSAIAIYNVRPLGSVTSRVVTILLVILAWAGWEGWKKYREWRANKQMISALTEGEAHNQNMSAKEIAELKQRFEQAVAALKSARFENKSAGGRSYLYQLPWYVFIGAPGSGKTTALVNSGLRFPLADKFGKDGIKGVGGTRNCDWWFTDQAVLLDTAGRYTTQSSNQEVDSSAWMGFLKLLKKFRPRQPLNGAIITLSVFDILTQPAAERAEYGRAVRQRIQELYTSLGSKFPLYIVVTKCDLLAGFMEFYNDLGREERAQVWGTTFEFNPGQGQAPHAQFEKEFSALEDRLNSRLYARLEDERDPQRRALIYSFPQQFSSLKPLVGSFLEEVFAQSPFEEQAMLRGVYFTSGTQEGSPFDRVLGSLSRAFGLERQVIPPSASAGKSYFITRLLQDVIFTESDLTGESEKREERRKKMLFAGYAGAGLLSIVLIAGWTVSYFRNQTLVSNIEAKAAEAKQHVATLPSVQTGSLLDILPALNEVRDLPAGYAQRDQDVPLTLGLGLYQGDKLGSQASNSYRKLLHESFLPRIALRLEEQIRSAENPEIRYEALKAYLMLYDTKHLDASALEAWVKADWQRTLTRDISQVDRDNLGYHLRAALLEQPIQMTLPIDRTLVDEARRALASSPLPQRVYSRLLLLGSTGAVPPFRISDAAGSSAPLVFARNSGKPLTEGLSPLFTVRGYREVFLADAQNVVKQLTQEEAWVLGSQYAGGSRADARQIMAEVRNLYLMDYVRQWDELLGDLRLAPARDLQQSIQTISLLSAPDSPLKLLLTAVAKETRLAASVGNSAVDKAESKVAATVRQTFDKILGDTPTASTAATDKPEALVDRHFEALHRLVSAPQGAPAPIDAVLGLLKQYQVQLIATDDAVKKGMQPPSGAMLEAQIKSEAAQLPQPVQNLLNNLISRSTSQAAASTQHGLQKAIAGGVGSLCNQAIAGRYPFSRGSSKEVGLGDFARLFGPGGQLDQVFRTSVQTYVDMSSPVWKPVKLAEGVGSVSPEVVSQFQKASTIRDAFFPGGSPNPGFSIDMQLIKLDDGLAEVVLTNEGQSIRFANGRPGATRLSWPSLSPANQIRLAGVFSNGTTVPGVASDGSWALFRLFDQARIESGQADRYRVSFSFEGRKALFEIRANSVRNPLRLPELGSFRCPA